MPRKGEVRIPGLALLAADTYAKAWSKCEMIYHEATPEGREKLLRWAMSCTTTNVSWSKYYVAQRILESHQRAQKHSETP